MALSLTRKLNFYSGNARRIAINLQQSHRNKATTPLNLGIMFVPQQVRPELKNYKKVAIFDDYFETKFRKLGWWSEWEDSQES